MSEVKEIETRIRNLPNRELAELRDWFYEFENETWDQQIQSDFKAGKFDKLIVKAQKELNQGKVREL